MAIGSFLPVLRGPGDEGREAPQAVAAAGERLPRATLAAIVGTELLALGSLTVPLLLGLALAVRRLHTSLEPEAALSVVTALGALAALVASPVLGSWCDRTRHRGFGRATFLLGGVVAGTVAIALLLAADSVAALAATWMLVQVAFNATFSALYGLMADLVGESDRARVSGWFGAAAVGSIVLGMGLVAVLPKSLPVILLTMPALALPVAVAAFVHLARLPRPAPAVRGHAGPVRSWRHARGLVAWIGAGQYWLVWVQRLLVQLAYGFVTLYGFFFLIRRVGLAQEQAVTVVAATSAATAVLSVIASVVGGTRAARHGSFRRFVVVSVALVASALVIKILASTVLAYVAASALTGVGIGCYYAVDLAAALRTVPAERAGLFLGLFNIARTLPGSLVPAAAPALLAIGDGDVVGHSSQNYAALYAAGLILAVAALVPLRWMTALDSPADAGGVRS